MPPPAAAATTGPITQVLIGVISGVNIRICPDVVSISFFYQAYNSQFVGAVD